MSSLRWLKEYGVCGRRQEEGEEARKKIHQVIKDFQCFAEDLGLYPVSNREP